MNARRDSWSAREGLGNCLRVLGVGLACSALTPCEAAYFTEDPSFVPVLEETAGNYPMPAGVMTAYPGSKLLLQCSYQIVNGTVLSQRLIRLRSDGSIDNSFHASSARVLAVYPDGRVLVQATDVVGGLSMDRIRRLTATGDPDTSFTESTVVGAQLTGRLLGDGRVLLSGGITSIDGTVTESLALLQANGGLDTSFHSPFPSGTSYLVLSVTTNPTDTAVYLAGQNLGLGPGRNFVARLSLNGAVDAGFDASGSGLSYSVTPQRCYRDPAGGVLIVDSTGAMVRLTATGAKDPTFTASLAGPSANRSFGVQDSNNRIYYLNTLAGSPATGELRRLNADGSADSAFGAMSIPADPNQTGFPVLNDDQSVFVNSSDLGRIAARLLITRVLSNGTVDSVFGPRFSLHASIAAYLRQPDGKYLVAGLIDYVNGTSVGPGLKIVRLNADGSRDATFGSTLPSGSLNRMAIQPDGKVLVGGVFSNGSGGNNLLIRLTSTGALDGTFHPIAQTQSGGAIAGLAVDSGGLIYCIPDAAPLALKRYSQDGVADSSFNVTGIGGYAVAVDSLPDGRVMAGFGSSDGDVVVRLSHAGALDATFTQLRTADHLAGLRVLPDSSTLVATNRTFVYSATVKFFRLSTSGAVTSTYVTRMVPLTFLTENRLEVAGEVFDQLRASTGNLTDAIQFDLEGPSVLHVSCTASGVASMVSTSSGEQLIRWQRTALSSPSLDPAPHLELSPSTSTISLAVNSPLSTAGSYYIFSGLDLNYQWKRDDSAVVGATSTQLNLVAVQASDAGTYTLVASNAYGTAVAPGFTMLVIGGVGSPPTISTQPKAQSVTAGSGTILSVVISGTSPISYQWYKDGAAIAGANSATYSISTASAASAGTYYVVASNAYGTVTSNSVSVTVVPPSGQLTNLSVRTGAGTGDGTLIVGVVLGGSGTAGTKPLLIRAMGPTLTGYGVTGALADPSLEVIPQGTTTPMASNDNWGGGAQLRTVASSVGAFPFVSDASKDAGLYLSLATGAYSAKVAGVGGTTGIALAEIYDASESVGASTPRLVNVSARAQVGTGEGVLIAGFVVGGSSPVTVLIRAVGPTLVGYGVAGALADPQLEVTKTVDGSPVVVASNDNWGGNLAIADAAAAVGAFQLATATKDAAVLVTLPPGVYSAKVSGVAGTTGVALVEVYEVP